MIAAIACGLLASHGIPPSVGPKPASVWLTRPLGSKANLKTIAISASDVAGGQDDDRPEDGSCPGSAG